MYTIRPKRTGRCKSCLVNCQDTENLEGDSKSMKTKIIVALMIVLSMCMVCAADLEGDKKYWCEEGIDGGYPHGYHDGYVGTDKSDSNKNYPSNCPVEHESSYNKGYGLGYDDGYADGALDFNDKIPDFPETDPDNGDDQVEIPDEPDDIEEPAPITSKPADKDDSVNCMSSPAMGLGFKLPDGTITQRGDQLPTLYTWAEANNKYEHHVPSGFWDTPKGQRILQWKANAG